MNNIQRMITKIKSMKNLFIITAILLFGTSTFAQKIKVSQSNEKIGDGRNNALTVMIYDVKDNDVLKEWKSTIKGYGGKVSSKFADDVSIPSISDNTIDIYATAVKEKDNAVKLIAGFDLGGTYLSSQHSGYKAAERILYDFAVMMTKKGIAGLLKDAEKILAKSEKSFEQLIKDNEKLHKDIEGLHQDIERYKDQIEGAKNDIERAENDIVTNLGDQEKAKAEVEEKKKIVQQVADRQKNVK